MGPVIIGLIASSAFSAMGAIQQGKSAQAAANANAQIAENNAAIARASSEAEESRRRRASEKEMGTLRTRIGKSGVTATGSILDVVEESVYNSEVDAMNARLEGAQQSTSFLNQANVSRAEGANAKRSGYISAAGTLAGGAYNYYKS